MFRTVVKLKLLGHVRRVFPTLTLPSAAGIFGALRFLAEGGGSSYWTSRENNFVQAGKIILYKIEIFTNIILGKFLLELDGLWTDFLRQWLKQKLV